MKIKGMEVNVDKTKTMIISKNENQNIKIGGKHLEEITKFKYLGSIISLDGKIESEIIERNTVASPCFMPSK